MTDQEESTPVTSDDIQKESLSITALEYGRRCSEQERRYCEQRVFHKRNMKESMRAAGSKAKEEYLSKLAWETENRPHVQEYLKELEGMISEDAKLALQEIVFKTRRAIDSTLLGKTPEKAEPLLRLMAEIGGFLKPANTPASQTNIAIKNERGASSEGSIKDDMIKFQQLTGVISGEMVDVVATPERPPT